MSSDSAERSAGSNRTHSLRKRIAQLEAKLRAVRKQAQAQRRRIAQKCGYEFLALIDSDRTCKVFTINVVQKLVVEDDEGNIVSETDSSLVGKIIEVRFDTPLSTSRLKYR